MPTVIVTFPKATPGCTCETCKEIREADRPKRFDDGRYPLRWPSAGKDKP